MLSYYKYKQNIHINIRVKFTCGASRFISALFTLSCPLGAISSTSSIKGQIHPMHVLGALMKSAVKVPSCSCLAAASDGCFTQSNPDKGPFDGLPFSNQSTPSFLGLQHLFQYNLILYSLQPDPIDKLNLSEPYILMPPWNK